jgi:hypothetical protein
MNEVNIEKLEIKRVRLGTYPSLFEKSNMGDKYQCKVYLDKIIHKTTIENLNKKIDAALTAKGLARGRLESKNICLRDVDTLDKKDIDNSWVLTAKSANEIDMRNPDTSKITNKSESPFRAGCFVNLVFSLYVYNGKPKGSDVIVKGISASLHGIQFAGHGEDIQTNYNDCSSIFSAVEVDEINNLETQFGF